MRPRPLISILWLFALCSLLPALARAQQVNVLVDAQTGALKRPDATTFKSANGIIDATTLIDTDNTLAANSDSVVSSQKAIKAYVAANSTAAFSGLTGQPTDNANLSAALGAKQPLPTYVPTTIGAITLGHDGIIPTDTLSGTKALTLASAGSSGDVRILKLTGSGTVTTNFAVIRNFAGSAATVSQAYTNEALIKIYNVGGTLYWLDNYFGALDLTVGGSPVNFTPSADNVKAYFDAVDTALGSIAATITGIDSAPIGTGQLWTTSDLANRPLNWLVADGTNGTPAGGTVGGMTSIIKGGGTVTTPTVTNGIIAGTYTGTQSVAVASATPGASLYYTFGSSPTDPTTSDTAVSGNISVAATGTLKVKAFKNLYTPSPVFGAAYTINPAFTYLISDDLIHVDNAAAVTAGWSSTNAGYWGNTTSPAPLAGFARSLRTFWGDGNTGKSITPQSDVWVYFILNIPAVTAGGTFFTIGDGTTTLLKLGANQSNVMTLGYGATAAGGVDVAYTMGTTYHIWLHYTKGTGSNAQLELFRSTDGIKGTRIAYNGNAPGTTDVNSFRLGMVTNGTAIFNKLRISATSIGDNPL